ncbi:MAG: N-acetyl-D-Glu racemase DgcA [Pseudomonadota bacterium]
MKRIDVRSERFALAETFTISRGSKTHAEVITVEVTQDGKTGRGECVPYGRYGETRAGVAADIAALPVDVTRAALQELMPAGAARNAVDCALWDLEAKIAGRRAWDLAGRSAPDRVTTAFTLSLGAPAAMQAAAAKQAHRPLLKIKLGTPDDMPRLEAVRRGAPDAGIVVDANEGWSADIYTDLAPHLSRLGVLLVEQPLPAGDDDALLGLARPVPVCADESCHDRAGLSALKDKYDVINIKLDKTGGLTEALALKDAALAEGFGIMVGCMVGTSLALAPALVLTPGAAFVDLDGPLLLAEDRAHPLQIDGSQIYPPPVELWG